LNGVSANMPDLIDSRSSRTEIHSDTGTLIRDLFASVERAKQSAASRSGKSLSFHAAEEIKTGSACRTNHSTASRNSETEELPQTLGLSAADWNLALLLIVHAQLVGTLEPGYDFANSINVHQVRAVGTPEQSRIQARE
jgi:hypothetical protein